MELEPRHTNKQSGLRDGSLESATTAAQSGSPALRGMTYDAQQAALAPVQRKETSGGPAQATDPMTGKIIQVQNQNKHGGMSEVVVNRGARHGVQAGWHVRWDGQTYMIDKVTDGETVVYIDATTDALTSRPAVELTASDK